MICTSLFSTSSADLKRGETCASPIPEEVGAAAAAASSESPPSNCAPALSRADDILARSMVLDFSSTVSRNVTLDASLLSSSFLSSRIWVMGIIRPASGLSPELRSGCSLQLRPSLLSRVMDAGVGLLEGLLLPSIETQVESMVSVSSLPSISST